MDQCLDQYVVVVFGTPSLLQSLSLRTEAGHDVYLNMSQAVSAEGETMLSKLLCMD
jgi:hypothetical protein